jgi:hypothetical protein
MCLKLPSYQIWYPKDFIVDEDEDGIVTITSSITNSNLTLSGYQVNQNVTEEILSNFFDNTTKDYTSLSSKKRQITDERIWLEGEFKKDNSFWVWWALSHSNQIISASANSQDKLSAEDYSLYIFMLDKMEIYAAEFEK